MDRLVGWHIYSKIRELRALGLNQSQVARHVGVNVKTVKRYWNLDSTGYAGLVVAGTEHKSQLDQFKDFISEWLREYPDLSGAQIHDWLKERYDGYKGSERSVRRYVAKLRRSLGLQKKPVERQYQAVPDPPYGQQLQVDFGEQVIRKAGGGTIKLRVIAAVLANSRYKWAFWSDKPFTSRSLVAALQECFQFLGGMPEELVFDQDHLVTVSENYGDIIYTEEFERFKQLMQFKVRLCRAADPESKGRIEAVVKYVKNNYAKNRLFSNLDSWNEGVLAWLARTGNRKIHSMAQKVPAQVFLLEKQHLRPIPITDKPKDIVTRVVRKDNTVMFNSNRYSVPLGTYEPGRMLELKTQEGTLKLFSLDAHTLVAEHQVSTGRGQLVQNTNHLRDTSRNLDELQEDVLSAMGASPHCAEFLAGIRIEKRRYARDQFNLLLGLAKQHKTELLESAVLYCLERGLYSAVDCRDTVRLLESTPPEPVKPVVALPPKFRVATEHRSLTAYTALVGGENDE